VLLKLKVENNLTHSLKSVELGYYGMLNGRYKTVCSATTLKTHFNPAY
jgi:hypothetical protein